MRRMLPRLSALLLGLPLLAGTAAARFGMPEPLTPRGQVMEEIYTKIAWAGTIVFLVVFALLAWIIYRYRDGTGHGRATWERARHNTAAEVGWTIVPLMVVLWVGFISYVGLVELDQEPLGDHEMEIQVVGSQWNWEARYPDGFSVFSDPDSQDGSVDPGNAFLVPADTLVLLNVTSLDVIHAFHIMDANRMTVGLVDANPSGDHVHNHLLVSFPEGTYPVQCREMCFNPGHAYMRATIRAVPQEEYDLWNAQRTLAAGARLVGELELEATDQGLSMTDNVTDVTGTRYIVTITNNASRDIEVETGPPATRTTIPAGKTVPVAVDMPESGDYYLRTSVAGEPLPGGEIAFTAVDAVVVDVDMGNFVFEPDSLELEAGTTYLINVHNVHTTAHNLFIGNYAGDVLASSPTVAPGGSGSFVYTPDETGTVDMWCNVPGHYGEGMHGDVHVHE